MRQAHVKENIPTVITPPAEPRSKRSRRKKQSKYTKNENATTMESSLIIYTYHYSGLR